jgi:gluconate 2-dehydrogenase alpha chain
VNLDSERKRAVGVTYLDAQGRMVEQPADLVILTSYVFNNARLMLLSGIGKPYDPVTGQGAVGKNYSYVTYGKVTLFFEDKVFNRFIGGGGLATGMDEFNGDNFDHSGLGFFGGAYHIVSSIGATPTRSINTPAGTPRWGSGWKKAVARYYDRSLQVIAHGACQSYRTNYLDLDPTYRDANGLPLIRLTFDRHENEFKMSAYTTKKAEEIAKVIGPDRMNVVPVKEKYSIVPYQSTHNIGGAAMGTDPSTSVVNKYLQSWDVPNLFVVGGSAFPQNPAQGPTATIGMLACWAADGIKEKYIQKPGPMMD